MIDMNKKNTYSAPMVELVTLQLEQSIAEASANTNSAFTDMGVIGAIDDGV